jgi:hypothetical protein
MQRLQMRVIQSGKVITCMAQKINFNRFASCAQVKGTVQRQLTGGVSRIK